MARKHNSPCYQTYQGHSHIHKGIYKALSLYGLTPFLSNTNSTTIINNILYFLISYLQHYFKILIYYGINYFDTFFTKPPSLFILYYNVYYFNFQTKIIYTVNTYTITIE